MKYIFLLLVTITTSLLISCTTDEAIQLPSDPEFNNCNPIVKPFTPEIKDYEFYIEGQVNGKTLRYPQVNSDFTNVSNTFFTESKHTWLQAYNDSTYMAPHWEVRFYNVDIENITLPHSPDGHITWYDNRIDQIIENADICQGIDNGCKFRFETEYLNNSMIIEKVSNQIVEGTFNGNFILQRTGFIPGFDTTRCYDITNGKFKINYRVE